MSDNKTPEIPDDDALASMSREDLVELGGKIDGVETIFKEPRWPVPGTKAEKRTERLVAYWLLLGGISGLALLLIFLFKSSESLANAYGIAVTGAMLADTGLIFIVGWKLWKWNRWLVMLIVAPFLVIDTAFFSSNLLKFLDGGTCRCCSAARWWW